MLFKCHCASCVGIEAVTVTVEVDMSTGVGLRIVGLPDNAVKESLMRVVTALMGYGYRLPGKRILINLAPADIRKEGSSFDLAIAIGLLAVSEQIYAPRGGEYLLLGELALDGRLRPVPGALPIAVHAREAGFRGCIFPRESAMEAVDLEGLEIYGVESLSQVIDILAGDRDMHGLLMQWAEAPEPQVQRGADFREVRGQPAAKRGLEIAAAGRHNLILIGSPGSGKTMMASCLPSILPAMSRAESVETSKIYSICGCSIGRSGLMRERPFRTPHHSASLVSLIGGGALARPGEISLAHNGVLYLDEMAQFPRSSLDALRQPLEDGRVTISRARYKVTYPASFMLIASMNPCPCGYYGDGTGRCHCTPQQIATYMARISGPMMDRLDMHIQCDNVAAEELMGGADEEPSAAIAERVVRAREIQLARFRDETARKPTGEGVFTNAQMDAAMLRRYCALGAKETAFLTEAIRKLNLSARAYSRILKLSRTIADLAGAPAITLPHLSEAIRFRSLDRLTDLLYR